MENIEISLTALDQTILDSYCHTIDGLAEYLGKSYEIVLHSLASIEHSVIYIANGEHTGRKVGAPITDKALAMLEIFVREGKTHLTYFSKNKKGEPLKSTTVAILGENKRIIGLLCMNFYMNTTIEDFVAAFSRPETEPTNINIEENFAENVDDLISATFKTINEAVQSDATILPSNKNKIVVKRLCECGIFNIKDAVVKVSELLGISKNTVYMHLRNLQGK